ncbi:phosphomannomutase/phosphoglucomutase [Marinihelvus fidelis]|uniref:phosphomannomutase n=2 Tax=Marinihelvus fidelis TaxID=2613842 RepID=A0A5N0TCY3_9GAMM|nr:phosphomannomutase/phosphoglucomutase [Marinihelvus fidelis]
MSDTIQAETRVVLDDPDAHAALLQRMQAHVAEIDSVRVFGADALMTGFDELGDDGFIQLDMLFSALSDRVSPVQMAGRGDGQRVAVAARLGSEQAPEGYVLVTATPDLVLARFNSTMPEAGYLALEHATGGNSPVPLVTIGQPPVGFTQQRLPVQGSMFQIVFPQVVAVSTISGHERLLLFLVGCLLLAWGVLRHQHVRRVSREITENNATRARVAGRGDEEQAMLAETLEPEDEAEAARLADLPHDLSLRPPQSRFMLNNGDIEPVELNGEIFRAYDIRGVMGKTLDAGVARQIGQAVGSLTMDALAGPVVVGRDGRDSGPELVDGLIEGILSTGCDVIDVGAVPTGALYFACYELGRGSGVMVTGSHNPPDYNGFKIMVGGKTLFGDNIYGLYERIRSGNLRQGAGNVEGREVLEQYRDRIASDIQLKRPLKVLADCGNGIGGVIAADVLRAIGAEVVPMFDDVDGSFPNHHPDPSEPENLQDLIHSLKVMDGDLGVAFDGDADRLGVVTPDGRIIYADRVMMLYIREILSRNPGAKIIYDVKCTGKLDGIIREAGGEPEMYKTGHSLMKNRMKEVGAPFAGELSGHFFFGDRWYGFDCGIYSAARLLEILADDERSPQEVFAALPDSVGTPELKVYMNEGENHPFIERFQDEAVFDGATVSNIDGVRADYPDGWGLVRASNTTPVLVLRFDADDHAALERVQEAFRAQLLALNPELELPF